MHLYVLFECVFCSHSPSVVWQFFSSQPKLVPTLRKITNRQTMMNAWNSNCSPSNCFDPNLLTRTKLSAGLPATLQRTSSQFEGRLHSHILPFTQMLVLFAVLLVVCEERFYVFVEYLPYVRRVISCILFSLEQSQVVELTVVEHCLDSI